LGERRITASRLAQTAAEQVKERLATVLESTIDGVLGLDHQFNVIYLNGNAARALGVERLSSVYSARLRSETSQKNAETPSDNP
jgi:PAS domain-containing protein